MARGKKDKVIKDVDGTIKFPTSLDIGKLKDKAIPNLSNVPLEITNSDIQIPNNIETTKDFEKNSHVHVFSVEKPLYLQIHIGNIYTIFGSGIITPSAYLPNRPFIDIQTHLEEGIILSNGAVNQLDDTQLLLEVSLSKNELQEIAVHDQLGFFCKPLPISRIKKIYVSSEAIKTDIVNTALSNDGGIIPKKLIFAHFPASLPLTTLHTPSPHLIYSDHSERLRLFDKFMGAIAYIKNYSLLIANKTSLLSPMPKHYFYALQALNNSPELQLVKDERAFSFYQQLFNYKEVENPLMRWLLERIKQY